MDPSTGQQIWALGRGWVVPHSMKLEYLQVSFAAFPASMALQLESLPLRGWCVCVSYHLPITSHFYTAHPSILE